MRMIELDGVTWSAELTGMAFGFGNRAEGGALPQANERQVRFTSGDRVLYGTVAQRDIDDVPDETLLRVLREAIEKVGSVSGDRYE